MIGKGAGQVDRDIILADFKEVALLLTKLRSRRL